MTGTSDMETAQHEAFLKGLRDLFAMLVEMDYLQSDDVSYPPHGDLTVEALGAAGLEQEAVELIACMPMLNGELCEREADFGHGVELAPSASGVSYLSSQGIELARQDARTDDEQLKPWMVRIARSNGVRGKDIVYDLLDGNMIEWNYEGTWQTVRQTPVENYFQRWIENLRSLECLPWHDGFGYVIHARPTGYEAHLANPSKTLEDVQLRHLSLSTAGITPPSIDEMFNDHIEILKAEHNIFWSKRRLYEEAGRNRNFNHQKFRASREEYEQRFREATSLARVRPKGQSIYNIEHGRQLREWYRLMAREHGV
ncbi:hypothetical protein PRZ48_002556 [Zasmidium cellare]|uniref:Uncharacterized protein n=1 Tax=Zasmidium cellare TaxID=395010 RepID=A0ABR0F4I4_ZASCE|nr:hypothetical protein PRZ48_002556 [Zasmidium cellare]